MIMLGDKKKIAPTIVSKIKEINDPSKQATSIEIQIHEDDEKEMGLLVCCRDLMDAIRQDDERGVNEALKAHYEMYEAYKDEEDDLEDLKKLVD